MIVFPYYRKGVSVLPQGVFLLLQGVSLWPRGISSEQLLLTAELFPLRVRLHLVSALDKSIHNV